MLGLRKLKLLAGLLSSAMVLSIVPANLASTISASTFFSYEGQFPSIEKTYRSVEDNSYSAEVKTVSTWNGHANMEIKFTNTGSSTIHDWYFTFDYNYAIENPFNCYIVEQKDNLYTIGNNDWNQDIKPGQSVTIGFTATSSDGGEITDAPSFYLLNTKTVTLSSSDLTYTYEQYSDWGAGFNGALIITNNSGSSIRDWSMTFGSTRPITQIDSAVLTSNSDGTYTITNDGNNQNIGNGQNYRIGLQGGEHDTSVAFELTDLTVSAKKLAYALDDDTNGNGILDVLEIDVGGFITPTATPTPEETPVPTSEPTSTPVITPVTQLEDMVAWSSVTSLTNDDDSALVVFYLDSKHNEISSVALIKDEDEITGLYDNGYYYYYYDDIGGDGIYSCGTEVDTTQPGELVYTIKVTLADGTYEEYELTIEVIDSDLAFLAYCTIVETVFNYKETEEYINSSVQTRVEAVKNLLLELEGEGYVKPGSVYIASDYLVCCDTIDGVGLDFICIDEDDSHNLSGDTWNSIGVLNEVDESFKGVKVLYMVAFSDRDSAYAQDEQELENKGASVTVNYRPNYSDYSNCLRQGYDVVVFSSHGVYDSTAKESRISSGIYVDHRDQEAVKYFNAQSRAGLIRFIPGNLKSEIAIRKEFFTNKYSYYPESTSVALFEGCSLFGVDGSICEGFGCAMDEIGVRYSAGFVNSVEANYSRDFCKNFIKSYAYGFSADESYDSAVAAVGANDEVKYDNDGIEAYPYAFGDGSCKITARSLVNAGFEYHGVGLGPNVDVYGWESGGDAYARIKYSDDIAPSVGKYMGVITTGIGSGESSYFSSSEGSYICQTFTVPSNAEQLLFDANILSEEPTEWIGSAYDDTFNVKIVDMTTGSESIVYSNSINRATWLLQRVDLNFDGGDYTTYQTGWDTIICDIKAYAGKEIKLVFTVYDVGDSDYDTVVLLDNVCIW